MPRMPSDSPKPVRVPPLARLACDLIADGRTVYRGKGRYFQGIWSVERNAPQQWNLWRWHLLDNEVVDGLWRGDFEWELWWWGEWYDAPLQLDPRYVIHPKPRKDLLEGQAPTECSEEETWRDRMHRHIKENSVVCRGTGRYGHQTWSGMYCGPDKWTLWDVTGDEPVESGLWRCTTAWRLWWWGEWNEVGVEEPVEAD